MSEPGLPLRTERLLLRSFSEGDFDAVHVYGSDPEVTRFMSWGPNDERATREFLEKTTSASRAEPRTSWELAIVLCETGALIGGCGLMPSRPPYREWELGYVLRPELWGQGIVSEAARAVLDFGFRRVGAHRVFARIDPENAASIRVAGKLGMRHEGTWRRDSLIRGEWRDTRVYALLDEEWEGLREAR